MKKKLLSFNDIKLDNEPLENFVEEISNKDIAIIGIAGKFPYADDVNEYWENIKNGIESIRKFPENRRKDADDYLNFKTKTIKKRNYTKCGYLDEIDGFDYEFFNLSPLEAKLMNPLQRIFLQTAWTAIEDGGYGGNILEESKTGLFMGYIGDLEGYKYKEIIHEVDPALLPVSMVGNLASMTASRISYLLNLKGPSMLIDTACSSSLVAVNVACNSIRSGECDMALAGGIRIALLPLDEEYYKIGIESSDSRTRSFDNLSDGSGLGEGSAAVLLKPLNKAISDGDNIYAVIRGIATNQDGRTAGITVPNPSSQEDVIFKAWKNAGINPETIAYIELHGTGTQIGDTIEFQGLQNAFERYNIINQYCSVGSVKTNIGHLYDCAGLAGLLKVVLALKNRQIPPSINFNIPNRKIDFINSSVFFNTRVRKYLNNEYPMRCAVSSFGISGTNSHVILEEAPQSEYYECIEEQVFAVSARTIKSLERLINLYNSFFQTNNCLRLMDVCFTTNLGRGHYNHRISIIAKNIKDLINKIDIVCNRKIEGVKEEWFFYGEHKIVPNTKKHLVLGELTRETANLLNYECKIKLKSYAEQDTVSKNILSEICNLYVSGAEIRWESFFRGKDGHRVSLPTYSFEPTRCWIDIPEVIIKKEQYFSIGWIEEISSGKECFKGNRTFVIFKDNMGKGEEVANSIRREGNTVIEVELSEQFEKINDDKYTVSNNEEDYMSLISMIKDKKPTDFIHMFSIDEVSTFNNVDELSKSQKKGVFSLFNITRAIVNNNIHYSTSIDIISNFANEVTHKEESLNPHNATLLGLGKVVNQEYVNIRCRAIDIDETSTADEIVSELKCNRNSYVVALRNCRRYVEIFEALEEKNMKEINVEIKNDGIYIITGGSGKIGLEIAGYFASKNKVNIALISRSGMPDRSEWNEIISRGVDSKECLKIEAILDIEKTGSKVECFKADVAEIIEMEEVIQQLRNKFGKINGIIHAAGLAGNGFIIRKSEEIFKEVMSPKVQGTWVLDYVTRNDDLDFFVMFSSGVAIIGEAGQGDYTSANSYMDLYSFYRNKLGKRTVSINWPIWEGARMGKGNSINIDGIFKAMPTIETIEAFDKILNTNVARIIVGEINYKSEYIGMIINKLPFKISKDIRQKVENSSKNSELLIRYKETNQDEEVKLKGRENESYSEIETILAKTYRQVLGIREVNIYDNFFEIGGDSIILNRMYVELEKKFPGKLVITDFFSYTSISKLAQYISGKELEETKASVPRNNSKVDINDDIAIIGVATQLPGANNIDEYWENIKNGIDLIKRFPESRRKDIDAYLSGTDHKWNDAKQYMEAAFLDEIDKFDYKFFKLSPKEAKLTDPCQKMFLQTAWNAIEDSGYGGTKLSGSSTGVYMGFANIIKDSYQKIISDVDMALIPASIVGNVSAMIPARVAYLLNLRGPAMVIDTACSSTLVAVHMACSSIRNGECDMALAGGIKLFLVPLDNEYTKIGIEASDGRTRTFDDSADGAGMGEGVGVIVLKTLSKAIEDKDNIYAVIKGSAINQDGASVGITAPNPEAQTEVIIKAWNKAGIDPETIDYIEAHGTGTKLGDPIEIVGLKNAFKRYTDKKQFCAIGSVKTNIGHLNECAGIAALIKAVLVLKNKEIPPNRNFNQPNSNINFQESPVYVNTKLRKWKSKERGMIAAVSAFGFSGTNCHMILEEAPRVDRENAGNKLNIFSLSANTEEGLKELISRYYEITIKGLDTDVENICYTTNVGRGQYFYRLAMIVNGNMDFMEKIQKLNTMGLENINREWFYYGIHRVVSENSEKEVEFAITEAVKKDISRIVRKNIIDYVSSYEENKELLLEICRLYTAGADVQWQELYKERKLKRVSLPGYPFEPSRCWIDIEENINLSNSSFYKMKWVQELVSAPVNRNNEGAVLIFKDNMGIAKEIISNYKADGREVIEVELGDRYFRVEESKFVIDSNEQDYLKLFRTIEDKNLGQIIHVMTVSENDEIRTIEELEKSQEKGIYSLLYIAKALSAVEDKIDVVLISDFVSSVVGDEDILKPENATFFGIGKAIRKENPNIRCRSIDIDEFTTNEDIISEIVTSVNIAAVAYRRGIRYVEEFCSIDINTVEDRKIKIKDEGVYIITGGAGGIGLEVAKFLSSNCNIKLALIGRSTLPSRDKWKEILDINTDKSVCKKIKGILDIEDKGSEVVYFSCDISNLYDMSIIIDGLREKYGKINGVINSAGVTSVNFIFKKDKASFLNTLSPKVYGTWILDHLTAQDDMDFFIMFSSISTIFDSMGQADYIAANSYMDSYASYRDIRSKNTLTVNWSTWKETGMACDQKFNINTLFKAILTSQAIEGFDTVLHKNITNVLIGEINSDNKVMHLFDGYPFKISDEIRGKCNKTKESTHTTKTIKTSKQVKVIGRNNGDYSETEKIISQICTDVLGFEEIDINDNFLELGADSILLKQMYVKIQSEFPCGLEITDLFEYSTVAKLSRYLKDKELKKDVKDDLMDDKVEKDIDKELDDIFQAMENGTMTVNQIVENLNKI